MLYAKPKKDALAIHGKAVEKYNAAYHQMEKLGNQLHETRSNCVPLIREVEVLVNSIANRPKEFEKKISNIKAEREKFRETVEYAEEALAAAAKSDVSIAAGVAGGAAVASAAPTAAMWVATTFGKASTGRAISTLSGAVAQKAALAWLGGGALTAGGGGVAAGQALLAMAGPIGWGITGVTTAASIFSLGRKNKKIADQAIEEAKQITIAGAQLNESSAKIRNLNAEIVKLFEALEESTAANQRLKSADYLSLSENERYQLGTMVNNTLTLAELLNKAV